MVALAQELRAASQFQYFYVVAVVAEFFHQLAHRYGQQQQAESIGWTIRDLAGDVWNDAGHALSILRSGLEWQRQRQRQQLGRGHGSEGSLQRVNSH